MTNNRTNDENKADDVPFEDIPLDKLEDGTSLDFSEATPTAATTTKNDDMPSLTRQEIINLTLTVLSWACVICNIQLAIATSPMITMSLGGGTELTAVPQGAFYISAGLASVLLTPWLFDKCSRKGGFVVGTLWGLLGTITACLSIAIFQSPLLFIVANVLFGLSMGIGFHLRFAAVEVVPTAWASRAVSLVVSGGCIAAIVGPESAGATRDWFGTTPDRQYLGVMIMTGVFNLLNLLFVVLIKFPTKQQQQPATRQEVCSILQTRSFLIPMATMTFSWLIMSAPMTLLRVVMHQIGFSDRQSLTGIELHFLGMYAPGFFVGALMQRLGPSVIVTASILLFGIGLGILQLAPLPDALAVPEAVWFLGMMLVGAAWNFGFNGGTVWLTKAYATAPHLKSAIQSANDCIMFVITGIFVASTSFLYKAGGEAIAGWRTVHWLVLCLLLYLLLFINHVLEVRQRVLQKNNNTSLSDETSRTEEGRVPTSRAEK